MNSSKNTKERETDKQVSAIHRMTLFVNLRNGKYEYPRSAFEIFRKAKLNTLNEDILENILQDHLTKQTASNIISALKNQADLKAATILNKELTNYREANMKF